MRVKKTILSFVLIAVLVAGLMFLINGSAPRVMNGGQLPQDLAARSYVLAGLEYDPAQEGYPIALDGEPGAGDVTLTLYFRIAQIWQGDTLLAELSRDSASQRTYSLQAAPDAEGDIHLLLKTAPSTIRGYSPATLFTRYAAQRPKIVVGTAQNAARASAAGGTFYRLLIGAYLMLIAACAVLFRRKTSERYLVTVGTAALFVLLYLFSALEDRSIPFPYRVMDRLSAMTNVLPVVCLAYTCVALFSEDVPPRCKRLFSLPAFVLAALCAVFMDMFLGVYMYQFMRRVMLIPVLITMAGALAARRKGARMVFTAYAMMEGITLFLYVSNSVLDMAYSPLLMFVRVKEISNLIFMSACVYQILDRFSLKFLEADHLAAEVSALNIDLERKVEERTAQLISEQQRKHALMLNIFHDLRSPVFVLKGRLEAMDDEAQVSAGSLAVMRERVAYLERLVEDLFLLAKLEDGDIQYDQDEVDMGGIASIVAAGLAPMAAERGVTLSVLPCAERAVTWGDPFRIQQAVANLTENAILYTPQGGSVTLQAAAQDGRCLLRVTDTGKGIPKEEQPRVFERYYRASGRNKRSSGLGLSIANGIINSHMGVIHVDSEVGRGSTFTVNLPLFTPEE